jgi:hypothetical protein
MSVYDIFSLKAHKPQLINYKVLSGHEEAELVTFINATKNSKSTGNINFPNTIDGKIFACSLADFEKGLRFINQQHPLYKVFPAEELKIIQAEDLYTVTYVLGFS